MEFYVLKTGKIVPEKVAGTHAQAENRLSLRGCKPLPLGPMGAVIFQLVTIQASGVHPPAL
jgi:hypothetical protein